MNLKELKTRYDRAIGQRDLLEQQLTDLETTITNTENHLENCQKVRAYIQIVAENTQKQIEYHFSNLVSMALEAVFSNPYKFILQFVQRRNKTEADLIFEKNGNAGDPMDVSGGGALDVASLALRISTGTVSPARPTIILDEPGKFLSRDLQGKLSQMIKSISEKLGIQFIIVSHIPEITGCADKVYNIINKKGEIELETNPLLEYYLETIKEERNVSETEKE